jgi:hypothetical protein
MPSTITTSPNTAKGADAVNTSVVIEIDEQPGADEAPDHAVDGQGPENRNAMRPPAALEDVGHVEDHRREQQKKDGCPHIGDQGQKGGGDHGKTDADAAVDHGGESDNDGMDEYGWRWDAVEHGHASHNRVIRRNRSFLLRRIKKEKDSAR